MPEPFSVALMLFGLKVATVKTMAAAPIKGVAAATSVAYSTGVAGTTAGAALLGVTLTSAAALGIGAFIHKAIERGFMSWEEGRRYAREVEKMPQYRQQKLFADVESTDASLAKYHLHNNGVYGY